MRHISEFFTRLSGSKSFIFDRLQTNWPEQNMKASRVAMSHELLEILQHCQATDVVNVLSGHESWFFMQRLHYGTWVASRDEGAATPMTKIESENE
jgi:hypothetical protein